MDDNLSKPMRIGELKAVLEATGKIGPPVALRGNRGLICRYVTSVNGTSYWQLTTLKSS